MTSLSPLEAILSSFNWSENSRAGHRGRDVDRLARTFLADHISGGLAIRVVFNLHYIRL
jgi:hypothetical protein